MNVPPVSRAARSTPASGNRVLRAFAGITLAAGLLLFPGCAHLKPTHTGFLQDYSALQSTHGAPSYHNPSAGQAHYTSFLVEPVVLRLSDSHERISEEDARTLCEGYREELRRAFATRYTEASAPGAGVIRVRAAVTAVGQARPVLNAVTMLAIIVPVTAGGASSEAEVTDSVTGERLAALQGVNNGGSSFLGGPVGYLTQYGQARRALRRQAQELAELTRGGGEKPVRLGER